MMNFVKDIAIWIVKLGVISFLVFYFIKADISVQILFIFLVSASLDISIRNTELRDKTDIQKERIDELESELNSLRK